MDHTGGIGYVPPRIPVDGKIARPAMVELRSLFSPRMSCPIGVTVSASAAPVSERNATRG